MITLNQGEFIYGSNTLKVCITGDYNNTDLVLVYNTDINNPVCQYQAYYVKYGVDYPENSPISANFKLTNSQESPININYDVYDLQKDRLIIKGELVLVNYYKNYDIISKQYSDLVLTEKRKYDRDELGLVTKRTQTTEWYLINNSIGTTNIITKSYNQSEAIQEGISRRNNIIDEAKVYCINNLGLNYSFDLLNSVAPYVNLFKDGYTQPLRDAISASTKAYLTIQNKESIVEILTF